MSGEVVSVALALIAVAVSVFALRTARGARVAAAATPTPARFSVRVMDGEADRVVADDSREYALLLSLSSGADAPVTVSSCLLRVTYRTRANFLGAVDLKPRTDVPSARDARPPVELPLVVKLGKTVERWVFFRTANVIPRHCRVQDYALIVSTDPGGRHVVDASLPSLLAADTDGQGPATWGWD
jgi:hypothetical protein